MRISAMAPSSVGKKQVSSGVLSGNSIRFGMTHKDPPHQQASENLLTLAGQLVLALIAKRREKKAAEKAAQLNAQEGLRIRAETYPAQSAPLWSAKRHEKTVIPLQARYDALTRLCTLMNDGIGEYDAHTILEPFVDDQQRTVGEAVCDRLLARLTDPLLKVKLLSAFSTPLSDRYPKQFLDLVESLPPEPVNIQPAVALFTFSMGGFKEGNLNVALRSRGYVRAYLAGLLDDHPDMSVRNRAIELRDQSKPEGFVMHAKPQKMPGRDTVDDANIRDSSGYF